MKNKTQNNSEFVDLEVNTSDLERLMDTNLPDPGMLEFYRGLDRRRIVWNEDIDDSAMDIALYIRKWNEEDREIPPEKRTPIKIFINTDGGSLDAVMHVIDTILLSKTPVITVGMGRVYSAGGLLLMAGHKRYVFPHTSCLIHDGSSGAIGNIGKVLDNLEFTKEQEVQVKEYILSRTHITPEEYERNYRRDWFLFSDEMVKLGIADEIVTDLDAIA